MGRLELPIGEAPPPPPPPAAGADSDSEAGDVTAEAASLTRRLTLARGLSGDRRRGSAPPPVVVSRLLAAVLLLVLAHATLALGDGDPIANAGNGGGFDKLTLCECGGVAAVVVARFPLKGVFSIACEEG